jgi:hypothetical protein
MKLTSRELATVLAALRYWQNDLDDDPEMFENLPGSGHFEQETPLNGDEIDRLCEELNCCPCANTLLSDRTAKDRELIEAAEDMLTDHFNYNDVTVHEDAEITYTDGGAWVDCQIWVADDDITEEDD